MSLHLKEIEYEGQKCLIVFVIPVLDRHGKIQIAEESLYLSHPFNKIVPKEKVFPKLFNKNTSKI